MSDARVPPLQLRRLVAVQPERPQVPLVLLASLQPSLDPASLHIRGHYVYRNCIRAALLASSSGPDSQLVMPSQLPQPSTRQRFGKRLQAARKATGLTQQQLGIRIGLEIDVAATRINRYERGVHDPDSETAQRLAKELGLPLAYLYSDNDALAEAILTFVKLPLESQQEALSFLKSLVHKALDDERSE